MNSMYANKVWRWQKQTGIYERMLTNMRWSSCLRLSVTHCAEKMPQHCFMIGCVCSNCSQTTIRHKLPTDYALSRVWLIGLLDVPDKRGGLRGTLCFRWLRSWHNERPSSAAAVRDVADAFHSKRASQCGSTSFTLQLWYGSFRSVYCDVFLFSFFDRSVAPPFIFTKAALVHCQHVFNVHCIVTVDTCISTSGCNLKPPALPVAYMCAANKSFHSIQEYERHGRAR